MLKLEQFGISGFKALSRFTMKMGTNMTLLVGMNGAGKSTILQALGFARFLIEGKPNLFFTERYWDRQDFRFRSNPRGRRTTVGFAFRFQSKKWGEIAWDIQWGLNKGLLFEEKVRVRKLPDNDIETIFQFKAGEGGKIGDNIIPSLNFEGSLMAALQGLDELGRDGEILEAILSWGQGIRSFELLSPNSMKKGTRLSPNDIGIKGDRLAGFLAALSVEQKSRIISRVEKFYPIRRFDTIKKRAGWIDLKIAEQYSELTDMPATHMSDGFMRLLALCAIPELGDDVSLVLLDEVEDGIEPHILTRLIELVNSESNAQIVATSHSPLIANIINSEDIRFVFRSQEGKTVSSDISTLPTFLSGAEYMGVGEIWANTELNVILAEALKDAEARLSQNSESFEL